MTEWLSIFGQPFFCHDVNACRDGYGSRINDREKIWMYGIFDPPLQRHTQMSVL